MPAAADTRSGAAANPPESSQAAPLLMSQHGMTGKEPGTHVSDKGCSTAAQTVPKRPTCHAKKKKKKKATVQTALPTHEETADPRELSRKTQSQLLMTAELSAQAFARRYEEAVKETPFGIVPMLYMDISGRRARRLVLRDIEKALEDVRENNSLRAIAFIHVHDGRLGIQLRSWQAYKKVISLGRGNKNNISSNSGSGSSDGSAAVHHDWREHDGLPVKVLISSAKPRLELHVGTALRELGAYRDFKRIKADGFDTLEWTATVILPDGKELPDQIKMRNPRGDILFINPLENAWETQCEKCEHYSRRICNCDGPPSTLEPAIHQPNTAVATALQSLTKLAKPAATATPMPAATGVPVPAATAPPAPKAMALPTPEVMAPPAPEAMAPPASEATIPPAPKATIPPVPKATIPPAPKATILPALKATILPVPEA